MTVAPASARGALSPAVHLGVAAAIISAILALAFVAPMPIWSGQPARAPSADSPEQAGIGVIGALVALMFALVLCVPFRPYALAIRAARDLGDRPRLLWLLTAVLALSALAAYPRFGTDLFEYVAYERLWRIYGENPLLARPLDHPEDWSFSLAWHPDRPNAYGPLWQILTWPINAAGGESIAGQVVAYKLLALAGYLLTTALVYRVAAPGERAAALVTFAWSPLVLFEVLGKAHNDVLVALFLVAAVHLAGTGRGAGGIVAVAACTLIKISAASGGPAIVKRLIQERAWGQLLGGAVASLVLAMAMYAPFWAGPRLLEPLLSQVSQNVWSPGTLALLASELLTGTPQTLAVRVLLLATWAACVALALWKLPVRDTAQLATATAVILLATVGLITTAFYAHYLVPVIALAAISQQRLLQGLAMALSIGSLATYAVELLALAFGPGWTASAEFRAFGSLLTLAPALGLLGWRAARGDRATAHV